MPGVRVGALRRSAGSAQRNVYTWRTAAGSGLGGLQRGVYSTRPAPLDGWSVQEGGWLETVAEDQYVAKALGQSCQSEPLQRGVREQVA